MQVHITSAHQSTLQSPPVIPAHTLGLTAPHVTRCSLHPAQHAFSARRAEHHCFARILIRTRCRLAQHTNAYTFLPHARLARAPQHASASQFASRKREASGRVLAACAAHVAMQPHTPRTRRRADFSLKQAPVASRAGPPQTAAQCTNLLAHTAPTPHREDAPRQREHSRVSDSGAPGTRSCHPRCVWVAPCTLHTQHAHPPQHTRRAAGVCKKTHANPHAAALVAPVTAPASPSPPHRCAT